MDEELLLSSRLKSTTLINSQITSIDDASLDTLPDDVIAHCMGFLGAEDLKAAELTSKRLRRIVTDENLWERIASNINPSIAPYLPSLSTFSISSTQDILTKHALQEYSICEKKDHSPSWKVVAFKRLIGQLMSPAMPGSLSILAVDGTSVDQPEEIPQNLINSIAINRLHITTSYWSSRGSEDEYSGESLAFILSHPVCLVHSVQIRAFKAWFQIGNPIYSPKRIRITLGGQHAYMDHTTGYQRLDWRLMTPRTFSNLQPPTWSTSEEKEKERENNTEWKFEWKDGYGVWTSPEYDFIAEDDSLQTFELPQPTVCMGGYLRIDLLGRTQRQMQDDLYYTCLCHVRCVGRPLFNFAVMPPSEGIADKEQLIFNVPDLIDSPGGLRHPRKWEYTDIIGEEVDFQVLVDDDDEEEEEDWRRDD